MANYFINERVEYLLVQYKLTGCTSIPLRDQIMAHAIPLCRQLISKCGIHKLRGNPTNDLAELISVAFIQIEKTLYKYKCTAHCRVCYNGLRPSDSQLYLPDDPYEAHSLKEIVQLVPACPHCAHPLSATPLVEPQEGTYGGSVTILYLGVGKVFNMWSQIARTVTLAYMKSETRDFCNRSKLHHRTALRTRKGAALDFQRFLTEGRELFQYDDKVLAVLGALEVIASEELPVGFGVIKRVRELTGFSHAVVRDKLAVIKLRSAEFTDSPLNQVVVPRSRPCTSGEDDDEC